MTSLVSRVARQPRFLFKSVKLLKLPCLPGGWTVCCGAGDNNILGELRLLQQQSQLSLNISRGYHCDYQKTGLLKKFQNEGEFRVVSRGLRILMGYQGNAEKGENYAKKVEDALAKHDKVLKIKLKAQRLDAVLKAGLGLSRNKIEKAIYDDRVRVNGERPEKKSQIVYEGDEIDVVRGYNDLNPEKFIDVSRVEIVELQDTKDQEGSGSDVDSDDDDPRIPAVLKRSKMLTIRNYQKPWKGSRDD